MVNVAEPTKEWESIGIKRIREWVLKKHLNSKQAFEKLLENCKQ